jgi:hypothetical protein
MIKTRQRAWRIQMARIIPALKRLSLWVLFTVFFSLVPLAFKWLMIRVDKNTANWTVLLGDGELAIIATALAAASIGEIVSGGQAMRQWLGQFACGNSLVCAVSGCGLFVLAANSTSKDLGSTDWRLMAILSIVLYSLTVVTGGTCVVISQLGNNDG